MPASANSSLDHAAVLDAVEIIARQAGAILRLYYERPRQVEYKGIVDLVTEADRASEEAIVTALHAAFPDHHIHGEEGGGYGPPADQAHYHWWVDPLDGTTNFAHRFPIFSVSIALSDANLHPILGVVYDPLRDECFKGIRGHGACLNGRLLQVSNVRQLAEALVVTGFPYDRWFSPENNVAHFGNFVVRTQGTLRAGSAALDLCYVAAGRCDVYWEKGPHPWDVQAGLLFVQEAGGRVSGYDGSLSTDALSGNGILATNGHLHEQALAVLQLGEAAPRPANESAGAVADRHDS